MYSNDMCQRLTELVDSPWPQYGKRQQGISPDNLAFLLREYKISPKKDDTSSGRGYYLKDFADTWLRVLGLDVPKHAKDLYA
jgi:hypothetical protein